MTIEKRVKRKSNLGKGIALMVGGLAIGAFGYFCCLKPATEKLKLGNLYKQTLSNYGDTNHDGSISDLEKEAFNIDLLKDKNAVWIDNFWACRAYYKDGSKVPIPVATEWIKNYKSSK